MPDTGPVADWLRGRTTGYVRLTKLVRWNCRYPPRRRAGRAVHTMGGFGFDQLRGAPARHLRRRRPALPGAVTSGPDNPGCCDTGGHRPFATRDSPRTSAACGLVLGRATALRAAWAGAGGGLRGLSRWVHGTTLHDRLRALPASRSMCGTTHGPLAQPLAVLAGDLRETLRADVCARGAGHPTVPKHPCEISRPALEWSRFAEGEPARLVLAGSGHGARDHRSPLFRPRARVGQPARFRPDVDGRRRRARGPGARAGSRRQGAAGTNTGCAHTRRVCAPWSGRCLTAMRAKSAWPARVRPERTRPPGRKSSSPTPGGYAATPGSRHLDLEPAAEAAVRYSAHGARRTAAAGRRRSGDEEQSFRARWACPTDGGRVSGRSCGRR